LPLAQRRLSSAGGNMGAIFETGRVIR